MLPIALAFPSVEPLVPLKPVGLCPQHMLVMPHTSMRTDGDGPPSSDPASPCCHSSSMLGHLPQAHHDIIIGSAIDYRQAFHVICENTGDGHHMWVV